LTAQKEYFYFFPIDENAEIIWNTPAPWSKGPFGRALAHEKWVLTLGYVIEQIFLIS
jgi:hypothetical protein